VDELTKLYGEGKSLCRPRVIVIVVFCFIIILINRHRELIFGLTKIMEDALSTMLLKRVAILGT